MPVPQHRGVLGRVGVKDEQVGDGTDRDPPEVVTPDQRRVHRCGRLDGRDRSLDLYLQPKADELVVLEVAHEIAAEPDAHASGRGDVDGPLAVVKDLEVLGLLDGCQAEPVSAPVHGVVSSQRRDKKCIVSSHQLCSRCVEQVAVLDGANAIADGVHDGLR